MEKCKCKYCNREFKRPCSLAIHEKTCKENPNREPLKNHKCGFAIYWNKIKEKPEKEVIDIQYCQYCGKECKNANSLRNHERLCKENPNRQILKSNFIEYNEKIKRGEVKAKNQFIKAEELGVEKPVVSKETREKISKAKSGENNSSKRLEVRQKISEAMKKVAKENPDKYSVSKIHSRVKHFWYNGFYIDGLWELEVAKFLESYDIKWIKPRTSFEYYWNNNTHLYYPDFYLPDYDIYIEVKGYETERDLAKYKVVKNLIVLKGKEIKQIKDNTFDIKQIIGPIVQLVGISDS